MPQSLQLICSDNSEAVVYEERLINSPYDVSLWLQYIDSIDDAISKLVDTKANKRTTAADHAVLIAPNIANLNLSKIVLYERAVKILPGSYKIWLRYLTHLTSTFTSTDDIYYLKPKPTSDADRIVTGDFNTILSAFERSLVRLNKMPRIWLHYVNFLVQFDSKITLNRRTFDRALQSLPPTQHVHIWPLYVKWSLDCGVPETAVRVQRRYIVFDPSSKETFSNYLSTLSRFGEAAQMLSQCINEDNFISPLSSTPHDLWMQLCEICSKHPNETRKTLDFDSIIRASLKPSKGTKIDNKFEEISGVLWCKLADYYTRAGEFERARSIYEEGLVDVSRVRDFSIIFDSYSKFEELTLTVKIGMEDDDGSDDESDSDADDDIPDSLKDLLGGGGKTGNDIELSLARAEYLMERRPLLLNSVLLRQNPHNIGEWLKRSTLFLNMEGATGGVGPAIRALAEGCRSVNSREAVNGNPASLWVELAKLYEENDDNEGARAVFRRVCTERVYEFVNIDDLAQCYCSWVEMELRLEDYEAALNVIRESVTTPNDYAMQGQQRAGGNKLKGGKVQAGLYRSSRLWNLYLDLEESLGEVETTKAAYLRCIELGVATPQMILNFATYLTEKKYFEEAFSAYEKGLGLFYFPQPHAKPIWSAYLASFTLRYGGTKMERIRELYERAIEKCPSEVVSEFFMPYGKLEEEFGLGKRAISVYERAATLVPETEKLAAYQLYIAKAESFFGATKTRPIYEAAIAALQDADSSKMCLQYSNLEKKLGEFDRARAALAYGAQLVDPRRDPSYWNKWHEFEVAHGNEETFREMLRIKRSVAAAFSTVNYNAAEMKGEVKSLTEGEAIDEINQQEGTTSKPAMSGFVKADAGKRKAGEMGAGNGEIEQLERQAQRIRQATEKSVVVASEEIDLDDLEGSDDDEGPQIAGAADVSKAKMVAAPAIEEDEDEIDLDE